MTTQDENLHLRLLSQVRSDFDRLRWERRPIRAQLLHRASNAEAEGVLGVPLSLGDIVGAQGAGNRDALQRYDDNGKPLFRTDPIVDVTGQPITNSAGEAFDIVMPASRMVTFTGGTEDFSLLAAIGERAGRIVGGMSRLPSMQLLAGWRFSTPADVWWALLFELAWAGAHPLLAATRRLWLPAENPNKFIPYDLQALRHLKSSLLSQQFVVPDNWLIRLPDAWVSEIENVASASIDAIDFLLSEFPPVALPTAGVAESAAKGIPTVDPSLMNVKIQRRFAVALSFPGERREFIERIAHALRPVFGEERILYDRYHEVELARPNLDLLLQRFYAQDSDLVVVFVCGEYAEKEWCGLEWRAVRDLMKMKSRPDEDVMFLRFDNEQLDGLLSIDGYIDISCKNEREVADLIIRRWTATR